jgi:hypothetical protein
MQVSQTAAKPPNEEIGAADLITVIRCAAHLVLRPWNPAALERIATSLQIANCELRIENFQFAIDSSHAALGVSGHPCKGSDRLTLASRDKG